MQTLRRSFMKALTIVKNQDRPRLLSTTPTAKPGMNWLVHFAAHHNQGTLAATVLRSLVWSLDSHSLFPRAFRKGVKQVCRLKITLGHQHLVGKLISV